MRAVTISEPGSPDVLGWSEVPDPVCGPGEVLVDVVGPEGAQEQALRAHRFSQQIDVAQVHAHMMAPFRAPPRACEGWGGRGPSRVGACAP